MIIMEFALVVRTKITCKNVCAFYNFIVNNDNNNNNYDEDNNNKI